MTKLNPSRKLAARSRAGCYLLVLAGLLASVMPLRADNPPTYLFQIDSSVVPGGFNAPQSVALDSSNNVYVTDSGNARVVKLDKNNNYLTQWGSYGTGNGQFGSPYGIAVDSSNNVYVTDNLNNRVEKFDSGGNYLTQWGSLGSGNGQFSSPWGIAVDSSNNVYVADLANNRVEKFDSNGNYLTQWGSLGSGNGQINFPARVAVDSSNNVYVTDTGNNRVEKFTSNGNYLAQWGSLGSGNGEFSFPTGLAVDKSNNVYVADNGNSRVEKFDSNGSYLTQWGSQGSGNGQFYNLYGIAVDSSGNFIYVADLGNNRVQVFVYNANILPPIFTQQPTNQTVLAGIAGINVTFSASVVGTAPFAYQWMSNNVALPNATNSTFTLINVTLADAATYSVLVTNSFGTALSRNAVLTVVPALLTTLPASSISLTGAVLNGSVTLGSDATVAWFEWGTDTNYGNIAGDTIVPGNNGSNSISATLSGLPGNYYHYRLDAANDFGIIYGNDISFKVGSYPTATTLAAVNGANGTTLNATVNPNGWDTTVYFVWGSLALTNSTPAMDIGAGATPLNVSSFITGLVQGTRYNCYVMVSNHLGRIQGLLVSFVPPFSSAPQAQWQSVASSADGTKLVAGSINGSSGTYTSTNRGATWTRVGFPAGTEGVASSADGTELLAVQNGSGSIFILTNTGAAWTRVTNTPLENWNAIAPSADGVKLAAVALNLSGVYTSTNTGVNWTYQTNGIWPYSGITYIASSADGSKLVAASGAYVNGPIFTSTNFGINWTLATNAPLARWYSVASSADGNKLMACAYFQGNVYLSTDAGGTWTKTSLPTNDWNSVAESADGTRMVALANGNSAVFGTGNGGIYTSTDSGITWVSNNVVSGAWTCAAMSADGNELIATIGGPSTAGGIYVSQTTPAPQLNLSASANDTVISWIIPSLDFTLQQSPDLLSWTDVTNLPVLNLTNLDNQVVLPPPAGNGFFRLMH
jgi:DNA-binding beta-propeller fold protein YncE